MQKYPLSDQGGKSMEIFDRVEFNGGAKVYFKNRPYPIKGYLTEDRAAAIALIKRIARSMIIPRIRWWTDISTQALKPYFLTDEFMSPFALEMKKLLTHFVRADTADVICYILENDNAYQLRLKDLFSETSKEQLLRNPIKEIRRLLHINKRRDYDAVNTKFNKLVQMATLVLLIPTFRNKFNKAFTESDFRQFTLDEGDTYWLSQRIDYNYDA